MDFFVLSGFNDTGEYWRSWYETPTFEQDVRTLFEELEPLYVELHAYVRKRLKEKYGKDLFPETGHIPAHLFGIVVASLEGQIHTSLPNQSRNFMVQIRIFTQ